MQKQVDKDLHELGVIEPSDWTQYMGKASCCGTEIWF